jgi:hypothetical protein
MGTMPANWAAAHTRKTAADAAQKEPPAAAAEPLFLGLQPGEKPSEVAVGIGRDRWGPGHALAPGRKVHPGSPSGLGAAHFVVSQVAVATDRPPLMQAINDISAGGEIPSVEKLMPEPVQRAARVQASP